MCTGINSAILVVKSTETSRDMMPPGALSHPIDRASLFSSAGPAA